MQSLRRNYRDSMRSKATGHKLCASTRLEVLFLLNQHQKRITVTIAQRARTASGYLGNSDNRKGVHSMPVHAYQSQTLHTPAPSRRSSQRSQRRASISGLFVVLFMSIVFSLITQPVNDRRLKERACHSQYKRFRELYLPILACFFWSVDAMRMSDADASLQVNLIRPFSYLLTVLNCIARTLSLVSSAHVRRNSYASLIMHSSSNPRTNDRKNNKKRTRV